MNYSICWTSDVWSSPPDGLFWIWVQVVYMFKIHTDKENTRKKNRRCVCTFAHLYLNVFTIEITRDVGLHEPIPSSTFHNGDGGYIPVTSLHQNSLSKLTQRNALFTSLITVIYLLLDIWPWYVCFNCCFRALIACSTMFKKGEYGGSGFSSVRPPGFTAFRWTGALSYIKNIRSCSGIRCRNSTRKSLRRSLFIPPSWAVWCTRLFVGETTRHKVTFFPCCPDTWRYALSPTRALPQLLKVHTL